MVSDNEWRFVGEKDAPDLFSLEMAKQLGIRVLRCKTEGQGDYSTNVALILARLVREENDGRNNQDGRSAIQRDE